MGTEKQDRSKQDRQIAILDATISLLARAGLDGVTHRAVDAQAGLPQGSTSYYFAKKSALLTAAAEHLATLLGKDCDALQLGFADHVARAGMDAGIAFVGEEVISYVDTAQELYLARMELTLASARREDLAGVGDALTRAARRPIEFFLDLISQETAPEKIDACAGLVDGIMLMYVTGQGPKPTQDQLRAVFQALT
ncbi:MAG: TetR family transcriptional regulator [Rhodobacteraceae bacterium]|nr:TetR family transcriptional regulator [Paracoccaceae bacterium]